MQKEWLQEKSEEKEKHYMEQERKKNYKKGWKGDKVS